MENIEKLYEFCPYCDEESEIENLFERQNCKLCGRIITPCSICETGYTNCEKCPLEVM